MYIPIFYGMDIYSKLPVFIENFYTMTCFCLDNDFPIIAQERYFKDPAEYGKLFSLEASANIHKHKVVDNKMISKLHKYSISEEIDEEIIKENNDIDLAWINLMNKRQKCLEKELDNIITQIKKDYNKEIKAFILFRHNASISYVAKKHKIKTIELEFSSMRKPLYNDNLLYFQFENKYSTDEFNKRYDNFLNEIKKYSDELPMLTRNEMLELLLSDDGKKYIKEMEKPEEYDFGVALGLSKDYEAKSMLCMSNEELITNTNKLVGKDNEILLRMHPSGISKNFKLPKNFILDESTNSIEFVLKCRRVASVLSNIGFEAMLYGKTSYILGTMPYKRFAISELNYIDEEIVGLPVLNYILFAYFVPYDLAFDLEYINWRMSSPKEIDIYLKHYNYLSNKLKKTKGNNSLNARKFYLDNEKHISNLNDQIKDLNSQIEILNKNIIEKEELLSLERETNFNIINSKSWKITKPVRTISSYIHKLTKR